MLQQFPAFSGYSVNDIAAAKKFYSETLGLKCEEKPEGLQLDLNGTKVFLYPKPDHTPASFTVLNFQVEDLEKIVPELTEAGVKFEHYDMEQIRTDEHGIAHNPSDLGPASMAWFTDPAGNIIGLLQTR